MSESMHIIASKELGGAENFYIRLVRGLKENGEEVSAIVRKKSKLSTLLKDDVALSEYPMLNNYDPYSMLKIRALIKKEQPDVVLTYMSRATALTRVPKHERTVHIARLGGYYDLRYFRHADYFVGNTKGICDYMIKNGFDSKRVFWISNFVDFANKKEGVLQIGRADVGIGEDDFVIMSLGRFIHKKGFDILIEAFAELKKERTDRRLKLLLVGDGNKKEELSRAASDLNVSEDIVWTGWQTETDCWFDMADVFVCPSREEPLGNVILEAWSHKLPVVATATDGAKELMEHEKNGLIAQINPISISKQIKTVINDSELAQNIASCGFNTLSKRHSKESIINSYKELYESVKRP